MIQPPRGFVAQQKIVVDKAHVSISITFKPQTPQAVLSHRRRQVAAAVKFISQVV
jgi:hypothetical protein